MGEKTFNASIPCIVMNENDNVVTLLRDVKKDDELIFDIDGSEQKLIAKQDVRFGHKLALKPIKTGETVFKYGDSIGVATVDIQVGEHVHVHNLAGVRGRGDK